MKRIIPLFAAIAIIGLAVSVSFGQSSPGFVKDQVPSPLQWNTIFAGKTDVIRESLFLAGYADGINCNVTGDTNLNFTNPTLVWAVGIVQVFLSSGSAGSATVGLYSGPNQTGTTLFSQQSLPTASGINTANAVKSLTAAIANAAYNYTSVYFNVGTPAGGPCVVSAFFATRNFP